MASIIDAQVHAYERDRPGRPWVDVLAGPDEMTGDQMVAAMDDVGVDGAILVSPWTMYRFDWSYAVEVRRHHPDRFALVAPFDSRRADVADQVARWADVDGAVGARIMLSREFDLTVDDPGVNRILAACAGHGLPVNLLCWGTLDVVDGLAARHPETRIVIDHLGLHQPFHPPPPSEPWDGLDRVLALGEHDNVVVKVTGACTLSHQPFPHPDIWGPLERLFATFGFDRLLWGTDWTRAVNLVTYRDGVETFRLSERLTTDERDRLMGGTLTEVYGWAPG